MIQSRVEKFYFILRFRGSRSGDRIGMASANTAGGDGTVYLEEGAHGDPISRNNG